MQGTKIKIQLQGIQMPYYSLIGIKNYNKVEDFNERILTDIE